MNGVCKGKSADETIKEATVGMSETVAAPIASPEDMLLDDARVDIYCATTLARIQDTTAFRHAAVLYRRTRECRAGFRAKIPKVVEQAHAEGRTPYSWSLRRFMFMSHPDAWYTCAECRGMNKDYPNCPRCKRVGFELNIEWPRRTR